MAQVNIRMDDKLKKRADKLFERLGLNMSSAITLFVCQAVMRGGIPFDVTTFIPQATTPVKATEKKRPLFGGWKGKIKMADDFDAPLDDFAEYMS
jgi:addiction module antitoxin, RelB/DinJ family